MGSGGGIAPPQTLGLTFMRARPTRSPRNLLKGVSSSSTTDTEWAFSARYAATSIPGPGQQGTGWPPTAPWASVECQGPNSALLLTQEAGPHDHGVAAPSQPHHTVGILRRPDGEHVFYLFAFAAQGLRAETWWPLS